MTREEAIDIIKCLAWHTRPDKESVEQAIKALEQEPVLDRDCEHCSKTYGSLGCCDTVSNKWVYSCKEGQREYLLNKIKADIAMYEADCRLSGDEEPCKQCNDNVFGSIYRIIDKYNAGSEQ